MASFSKLYTVRAAKVSYLFSYMSLFTHSSNFALEWESEVEQEVSYLFSGCLTNSIPALNPKCFIQTRSSKIGGKVIIFCLLINPNFDIKMYVYGFIKIWWSTKFNQLKSKLVLLSLGSLGSTNIVSCFFPFDLLTLKV